MESEAQAGWEDSGRISKGSVTRSKGSIQRIEPSRRKGDLPDSLSLLVDSIDASDRAWEEELSVLCPGWEGMERWKSKKRIHEVAWEAQRSFLVDMPARERALGLGKLWHPAFRENAMNITLEHCLRKKEEDKSKRKGNKRKNPASSLVKIQKPREEGTRGFVRGEKRTCTSTEIMDPEQLIRHLKEMEGYEGQIEHIRKLPGRIPSYSPFPSELSTEVRRLAEEKGAGGLYSHQHQAVTSALRGEHVVVSTSTASGKSLCAHLPVFDAIVRDPKSCALYIFPTKALAQDQAQSLRDMAIRVLGQKRGMEAVAVYDGDTPLDARGEIVRSARIWITNPDMVHVHILPDHKRFSRLLSHLAYVVIDEAHAYGGVFGSHVSMTLRRLRRVCSRQHGVNPTMIMLSATLPRPDVHASALTGTSPFVVVDQDGSPCGEKLFLMWNPSLVRSVSTTKNQGDSTRRAQQEEWRELKRERRSARGGGARLGTISDTQWEQEVALGRDALPIRSQDPHRHAKRSCDAGAERSHESEMADAAVRRPLRVLQKGVRPLCGPLMSAGSLGTGTPSNPLEEEGRRFPDWKQARYGAAGTRAAERRVSSIVETAYLLTECVKHGLRTIAFCSTRKLCELVLSYTVEALWIIDQGLASRVSVYRGGYSAEERRAIEGRLFRGELLGVAATNALELGVDIGSLDVTLHLGFPGSYASFKQQAGRAGRREQISLGIFVAWDAPLDQFFMRNPDKLFEASAEDLCVDPTNRILLEQHLMCAAAELPLDAKGEDVKYFTETIQEVSEGMISKGILGHHPRHPLSGVLHYIGGEEIPARQVSLREINSSHFVVIEQGRGKVLEEIEEHKAFFQIFEGAVYMHQGRTYLCQKLDLDARIAYVRPQKVDHYTAVADYTDIQVVGGSLAFPSRRATGAILPSTSAITARAVVTQRWFGYHSFRKRSGICFDTAELYLPDLQYETVASYVRVPHHSRKRLRDEGLPWREGLHGACHALLHVVPMYIACGQGDLGTQCDNPYDTRYRPERILVFDRQPGGVGLSARIGPLFSVLLERALELVSSCPCTERVGCPACVQHPCCTEHNAILDKHATVRVLQCTVLEERDPTGEA